MDNDKIETMLLKLIEDMAVVKAKLDNLEEIKIEHKEIANKIERLEMQNERHEKQISSLEHRANETEQCIRDNITDSKKTMVSVGLAFLGAILSFVFSLL